MLWDMVHDRTHSHGDLPFDPFMIKQRMPFWMYGAGGAALRPDRPSGRPSALRRRGRTRRAATCSTPILFDRLFRFPVTGDRVRNYDGLGGQLLFAYLHQHDVLRWTDNQLCASTGTGRRGHQRSCAPTIETLYRDGIDRPKLDHWFAAYELVSRYLAPHPGSRWAKGPDALDLTETAAQARRRRAAGRVPAQHVLRGAAQEAARRDRLHQGHHRGLGEAAA